MITDGIRAFERALENRQLSRYPNREDFRFREMLLFPMVAPSFRIEPGQRVFTIGSCFARNIEDFLTGYDVPTRNFTVAEAEWRGRSNGLLNEYNAGTIAQRMTWAVEGRASAELPETLLGTAANTIDLLLPKSDGVTRDRAVQRRVEIDSIYAQMRTSNLVVLTLGLTECWYDNEASTFLNRVPPPNFMRNHPGRYSFINLDVADCVDLLRRALSQAVAIDGLNILLTVSPVPLQTTFTGLDCVTANARSKAVLRTAADQLCQDFAGRVDYFPSYEIVVSGGISSYGTDNVHVRNNVVGMIMDYMLDENAQRRPVAAGDDATALQEGAQAR